MTAEKTIEKVDREFVRDLASLPDGKTPIGQLLINAFMDGCRRTMDALQIKEQEEK